MYAPRPARTTIRAIVERTPRINPPRPRDEQSAIRNLQSAFASPPSPPGVDARAENRRWNDQQRQPHDVRLLRRRQRDAAIVRLLRPDRNQVLLLRQPADR